MAGSPAFGVRVASTSRTAWHVEDAPHVPGRLALEGIRRNDLYILTHAEFTSICPLTGAPDFGTLTIRYVPADRRT